MKLKGKVSILIDSEGTKIKVVDEASHAMFVQITLTPQQLSEALSRISNTALSRTSNTECELKVRGLDKVGKVLETDLFRFEIPSDLRDPSHSEALQEIAQSQLSDGWVADSYFRSQKSFQKVGDKDYAQCVIRRWL